MHYKEKQLHFCCIAISVVLIHDIFESSTILFNPGCKLLIPRLTEGTIAENTVFIVITPMLSSFNLFQANNTTSNQTENLLKLKHLQNSITIAKLNDLATATDQ